MHYILMLHAAEAGWATMTEAQHEQAIGAYYAYTESLKKAGVLKDVNRLQPSSTTTTVRVANGKSQVLNGPYVDTKEQLGGFYIIDVPDLQAAVAWAERCPTATHGTVEVRALWSDAA
jgi:hypothetical protein